MANRPVYIAISEFPYVKAIDTDFTFCSGFSMKQRINSMNNLHESFCRSNPCMRIIEISRASQSDLGRRLSAFNLTIDDKSGLTYSVESAFQSSKCFEKGGPYKDILLKNSIEAKKDIRLKESGDVVGFEFYGVKFPTKPMTYFYDWLYIHAVYEHKELWDEILQHDAFTDIMFNPQKQINCQARSLAMFVGLHRSGVLDEVMNSRNRFLECY